MKKFIKSILAAMLCAIIAIGTVGTTTAQAAENTTIKVTYKKKSAKITIKEDKTPKKTTYKALKKKLGKANQIDDYGFQTNYTWTKGKSYFNYTEGVRAGYFVSIEDKNVTFGGIKVGMKKNEVEKLLKKVCANVDKAETTMYGYLSDDSNNAEIQCSFEKGKLTSLYATLYLDE